jgi:CIC family chloride channel protein
VQHRDRLARLGRRSREVVLLAAVTGALTGGAVALFEWVAREQLFDHLRQQSAGVQVAAPFVALVLASGVLRWFGRGANPATADEYVHNFHQRDHTLPWRPVLPRLTASALTLGLGGALGYEGPAVYAGAAIGSALHRRLGRFIRGLDPKLLLVCGAAAGVAAVFKAPATGLVFALEVPYREDFARRLLLPAGIAAAVSYVTFVAFAGTEPLFSVGGTHPDLALRDLGTAALLGVGCGVGARLFTHAVARAKEISAQVRPAVRIVVAGTALVAIAALAQLVFGEALTVGAGYDSVTWALDPDRATGLVLLLLLLRAGATVATVAGGGVGGLFIPLVVEGALVGRLLGSGTLFPLVGMAAFLGAGYRVPLAGVMFVAESTGRPGFVVPGVIASMVAQLFMGRHSASIHQVSTRDG